MLVKLLFGLVIVSPIFCIQHTSVLILARGGSKGIRLKNIVKLGDVSLLARTILIARKAGFRDITVSTDHPLIALEALKYKASVYHRSYITSTDWAPSIWGVSEFLHSRNDIEIVILLQTTSLFVKAEYLLLALKKLSNPEPFDCIFSAKRVHQLRWSHSIFGTRPLNFKLQSRPRRQDWDGEFIETGGFYISRRDIILNGYIQNNNCTIWEINSSETLEIDTIYDLELANMLISKNLV